jgi:transcriptional regulator with XRE-family HTH domain
MLTIELFRRERHWTQKDLSRASGVTVSIICMIEKGRYIPTQEQLTVLSRALNLLPEQIVKPVDLIALLEHIEQRDEDAERAS